MVRSSAVEPRVEPSSSSSPPNSANHVRTGTCRCSRWRRSRTGLAVWSTPRDCCEAIRVCCLRFGTQLSLRLLGFLVGVEQGSQRGGGVRAAPRMMRPGCRSCPRQSPAPEHIGPRPHGAALRRAGVDRCVRAHPTPGHNSMQLMVPISSVFARFGGCRRRPHRSHGRTDRCRVVLTRFSVELNEFHHSSGPSRGDRGFRHRWCRGDEASAPLALAGISRVQARTPEFSVAAFWLAHRGIRHQLSTSDAASRWQGSFRFPEPRSIKLGHDPADVPRTVDWLGCGCSAPATLRISPVSSPRAVTRGQTCWPRLGGVCTAGGESGQRLPADPT